MTNHRRRFNPPQAKGFTLVELLVVITILAVLATLAIPNYRKSVIRTLEDDAVIKLKLIRSAQRMYYLDNNSYTSGGLDSAHDLVSNKYIDNFNVDTSVKRNPYKYSSVIPANDPPDPDDIIGKADRRDADGAATDLLTTIEITYEGEIIETP